MVVVMVGEADYTRRRYTLGVMLMAFVFAAANGFCGAYPAFHLNPVPSASMVSASGRNVQVHRRIDLRLAPSRGIGTAPRDAHALGAFRIAREAARNFSGTISASGVSRATAFAALRIAAARFVQNANAQLQLELRTYDRVTEFGHAQDQGPAFGFPGGPNC